MRERHVGKATIELVLLVVFVLATGFATATAQAPVKAPDATAAPINVRRLMSDVTERLLR